MPRLSLAGFTDSVRRPRFIIWTGVAVLAILAVVLIALGVTSTNWFCANACHKVQDDTITAYDHSSHDKISCIACHMPVNSDPLTFALHKIETLGELWVTVTNRFELPINPDSELAQNKGKMPAAQCTQCHDMSTRSVTPSAGIIIDHKKHSDHGIQCTMCHNRTAHKEDFRPKLRGNNFRHQDFMKMEACFRCHSQKPGGQAPGTCSACHPGGFELKPENHSVEGFYPKGHSTLARADQKYCNMCHDAQTFCDGCHGLPMPHPANFADLADLADPASHNNLLKAGKVKLEQCLRCHGTKTGDAKSCNACHHPDGDPNKPWIPQHSLIVRQKGFTGCLSSSGGCHESSYCAACHVRGVRAKP
jgi:hypothetical protein